MTAFRFKEFEIHQDRCAMKIGTDGMLLGAWASITSAENVLDLGTGTGLLALMTAQRNLLANILAVEIDAAAAAQAQQNFEASPWHDRLTIKHTAIQQLETNQRFDHIISNPPFFSQGLRSAKHARRTARHTDSLSYRELLHHMRRLLTPHGKASVVLPADARSAFVMEAAFFSLYPHRLCLVYPKENVAPKRVLMELGSDRREVLNEKLIIHQNGGYTPAYKSLTDAFYLGL